MALEDGAGLREGTDGTIVVHLIQGRADVSLVGKTITLSCKYNGGSSFAPAATKLSRSGETAGLKGYFSFPILAAQIPAGVGGAVTVEVTVNGVNPNAKVIRIPVRPLHGDAP